MIFLLPEGYLDSLSIELIIFIFSFWDRIRGLKTCKIGYPLQNGPEWNFQARKDNLIAENMTVRLFEIVYFGNFQNTFLPFLDWHGFNRNRLVSGIASGPKWTVKLDCSKDSIYDILYTEMYNSKIKIRTVQRPIDGASKPDRLGAFRQPLTPLRVAHLISGPSTLRRFLWNWIRTFSRCSMWKN